MSALIPLVFLLLVFFGHIVSRGEAALRLTKFAVNGFQVPVRRRKVSDPGTLQNLGSEVERGKSIGVWNLLAGRRRRERDRWVRDAVCEHGYRPSDIGRVVGPTCADAKGKT